MRKSFKKAKFTFCMMLRSLLQPLMKKAGFGYDVVKLINDYYQEAFDRAPRSEMAVLLPHCLVDKKCPAKFSKEDGVICVKCLRCHCGEIKALCEEKGIQFYISPSSGFSQRLAQRKNLQAAIGAICPFEVEKSLRRIRLTGHGVRLKSRKVIPQIFLTSHYDCLSNDVDWEKLKEIINHRM